MKAAVRVSIIGFDGGEKKSKVLDGVEVEKINVDLTSGVDLLNANVLIKNIGIAFQGITKSGRFNIKNLDAQRMLAEDRNSNGNPNSDVVKPWVNATDITRRPCNKWIIDFGTNMLLEEATQYLIPFEHVRKYVKPVRDKTKRKTNRVRWWLFGEARPGMREAISSIDRYIITPCIAKHRLFVWMKVDVIPSSATIIIARDDDYFLGVLHSKLHELWALKLGTSLTNTPRYTPTTTFQTFPFPYPPNNEPKNNPHIKAISATAKELDTERNKWLNPPNLSEKELKKCTLTNLYNQRPLWLDKIHKRLDNAVFDAYGWPHNLTDNEILERLLRLNLKRSQ